MVLIFLSFIFQDKALFSFMSLKQNGKSVIIFVKGGLPVKDFIKKVPTSSIVLLIVAVFFASWGIYQMSLYKPSELIENAVQPAKGEYLSENEGKYVCVSGKPVLTKAPSDPLTGVEAKGLLLVRTAEMYQYVIQSDTVVKKFSPIQQENILGDGGEEYDNPAFPEKLQSAVFIGEAKLGGFEIAQKFLAGMGENSQFLTKEHKYKEVNSLPETNSNNLSVKGGYYTDGNPDSPQIGDIRIRYSYLPASSFDMLTLFGIQKNGAIGTDDNEEKNFMSDTLKNKDEISDSIFKGYRNTAIVMFFITGGLVSAAAAVYFVKNRKKAQGGTAL